MKKILIVLGFFLSLSTFACQVEAPQSIYLFADLIKREAHFFKNNSVLTTPPIFSVMGCERTAQNKKALMIAIGAEQFGLEDAKRSLSYTGEYNDDKCVIKNAPITQMPFTEKFKYFKKKSDLLKKCLEVHVVHKGMRPLSYTMNQKGCIIKKINDQEVSFQGGFCFFKPFFDSTFNISVNIKPSCLDVEGVKDILQGPQELSGSVNFYVAGDDTGTSPDLTAIRSSPMTLLFNPTSDLMPLASDMGIDGPRYPGQWVFPEIFFGKILMTPDGGENLRLKTPLFVDHRCPMKCAHGICSGPCDYSTPIAGEFVLKEISKDGKETFLKSWYDGGFSQANWQGIINGQGQSLPYSFFKKGMSYKLEFNLIDPKTDFEIFKNRMRSKIPGIDSDIGGIKPGESIGSLNSLPQIPSSSQLPHMGNMNSTIGGGFGVGSLDPAIIALNSKLSVGNWPPYFEEFCSPDLKDCKRSVSFAIKAKLTFTVLSEGSQGQMPTIGNFEYTRETPWSRPVSSKPNGLAEVSCP